MHHDELVSLIDNQIERKEYSVFSDVGTLGIVAIDEELRFDRCIDYILAYNKDIRIVVVAHSRLFDYISQKYDVISPIRWSGKYNDDIATVFREATEKTMDAFLYFSEQEINRRDVNLIHVAELLDDDTHIRVFCNSIGDELYEIRNVHILNHAYRVYNEMNELLYMI